MSQILDGALRSYDHQHDPKREADIDANDQVIGQGAPVQPDPEADEEHVEWLRAAGLL